MLWPIVLVGQTKMGRYHKNLLYEADLYFLQGDYYYASELYVELLKVEPDNGEILGKIGISYFNLPTFRDRAQEYLELSVKQDYAEASYYLSKLRHENYRFHEALELLKKYSTQTQRFQSDADVKALERAIHLSIEMVKTPLPVTIFNLGEHVNSTAHDYAPVWDIAGSRIIFTSRRRLNEKSEKDYSEQFDENIFEINLAGNEMVAKPAFDPLNSRSNDAAVTCSADGRQLIIYRTSKDGTSGDLYYSEKLVDQWSEPKKFESNINSKWQEASAAFANPEGTVLYFSSDRPGGFGGKDLYMVNKLPDGSWGEPMNLGEPINTAMDDDAPFVDAEGGLYFSTNGHNGMGGFDIFHSTPGAISWGEPVNIGYPINTPGDDMFFVMDTDGKVGYFSSDRYGSRGLQDIYKVVFDEENTVICKFQFEPSAGTLPPLVYIDLVDEESGNTVGYYQTETVNRTAILPFQTNRNYTLRIKAEGYVTLEKAILFQGDGDALVEKVETLTLSAH